MARIPLGSAGSSAPSKARPTARGARRAAAPSRLADAGLPPDAHCSVARTIEAIGDGWTFMVLRECYFGVRRFEKFQDILGVPRTTLTSRLRKLCEEGLLRKVLYSERPPRHEYKLTPAGIEMYPVMLALMSFGDDWLVGPDGKPLQLVHKTCGNACSALVACSHCRRAVYAREVSYRDGPGAGSSPPMRAGRSRRSADPTALERRRPSSVARALRIIGDRWTYRIIRLACFRVRRFDDFQAQLGIATNILADRLERLVADGIFIRTQYQTGRYEYRFTEKGRALYGPLLAMLQWGDRWRAEGQPPLLLTHRGCEHDFAPMVVCDQCLQPVIAGEMDYVMHYDDPKTSANARRNNP